WCCNRCGNRGDTRCTGICDCGRCSGKNDSHEVFRGYRYHASARCMVESLERRHSRLYEEFLCQGFHGVSKRSVCGCVTSKWIRLNVPGARKKSNHETDRS